MIIDHFAAVEADFQRFYSLDLAQAIWGPDAVSARRLGNLVQSLPSASVLVRALAGWGEVEELLALNAELTHATFRLLVKVYSKDGNDIAPLIIPRPNSEAMPAVVAAPKVSSPAQLAAFFDGGIIVAPEVE